MKRVISGASQIALMIVLSILSTSAQTPSGVDDRVLWAPPAIDLPDEHPISSVPHEMISTLRVGSTPIVLNDTSRSVAQKALGGTVGMQGDAGNWEAWLCYHGRNSNGRWLLWLLSSEVDNENVSGLQWMRLSTGQRYDRRCKLIPGSDQIKLPIDLRPGMTESKARRLLGDPTFISGNLLEYSHEHTRTINQLDYTVTNDVNLVIEKGRVQSIQVWRSEIN